MATREQLQLQLTQAEMAYHSLMLGKSPRVVVDQNGERVEFTVASAGKLLQYIERLRGLLAMGNTARPLRPYF